MHVIWSGESSREVNLLPWVLAANEYGLSCLREFLHRHGSYGCGYNQISDMMGGLPCDLDRPKPESCADLQVGCHFDATSVETVRLGPGVPGVLDQ